MRFGFFYAVGTGIFQAPRFRRLSRGPSLSRAAKELSGEMHTKVPAGRLMHAKGLATDFAAKSWTKGPCEILRLRFRCEFPFFLKEGLSFFLKKGFFFAVPAKKKESLVNTFG